MTFTLFVSETPRKDVAWDGVGLTHAAARTVFGADEALPLTHNSLTRRLAEVVPPAAAVFCEDTVISAPEGPDARVLQGALVTALGQRAVRFWTSERRRELLEELYRPGVMCLCLALVVSE